MSGLTEAELWKKAYRFYRHEERCDWLTSFVMATLHLLRGQP